MRFLIGLTLALVATAAPAANWPAPTPSIISGTPAYVQIPDAAVPRDLGHAYKALIAG